MAVSVLNSTAVSCISFSAIGQVSATNPPQTQSCKTLYKFTQIYINYIHNKNKFS